MRKPSSSSLLGAALGLGAGVLLGHFGGSLSSASAAQGSSDHDALARTASARGAGNGGNARTLPGDLDLEGLKQLMRGGRGALAAAKVTVALGDLPKAKLEDLARQLRETSSLRIAYDQDQYELQNAIMQAWASADPEAAVAFVKDSPSKNFRLYSVYPVFSAIGESDPERAIQMARSLGNSTESNNALSGICAGLSRQDPRRALEMFNGMKEITDDVRIEMIQQLARIAPEEAAAAMAKISPAERGNYWSSDGMFGTWAAKDPEAVLTWAQTATDLGLRNAAMKAACGRLAADDPAAALQRVSSMPQHLRGELLTAVMQTWADTDLKGALAAAGTLALPAEREQALSVMANQLGYIDPLAATDVILSMPKGNARDQTLYQMSYYLARQTPEQQMATLDKFSGPERSRVAATLANGMIARDPEGAIKLFNSVPATERGNNYALQEFSGTLAAHSPEMALDFAAGLDSAAERNQTIKAAITQMVQLSPADAAARIDRFTDPNDRQQALSALAENWGARDPSAALSWASSLSGDERISAMASLLPRQAADDPQAAGAQFSNLLANPGNAPTGVLQSAASELAGTWAGRDPQGAAAWVATLPAGTAAEAGAAAVVGNWARTDPAAAATWLATLPAGGMRDAAIEPLVTNLSQKDPDSSFSWTLSVSDPIKRATLMETTLRAWNQNDPKAAQAALEGANLDAAEKAGYEKILK